MPRCSLLALIAFVVLAAPQSAHADAGDIIVMHEAGLDGRERRELRKDAGVKLVAPLPLERTELVEPSRGETAATALAALRADDDVVYAELDQQVHLLDEPNDLYWPSLWGLENAGQTYAGQTGYLGADISALAAWERSQGAGVTVAVVDTGINADHVDLAGQQTGNAAEADGTPGVDDDGNGYVDDTHGWDFVTGDNVAQDGHGHGTHVSGTIAAAGNNSVGVIGVAPGAKVLPLRALGDNGFGSLSGIIKAFDYAGDLGIPIVNASFGIEYSYGTMLMLGNAVAAHPDTLFVVAAGNDHADNDVQSLASYPCALPSANVICVGASDNRDQPAFFSNYGATTVDLFAPGVGILSTHKGSTTAYTLLNGTSMASPHVAGAAALALAADPTAGTAAVRSALLSSADAKPSLSGLAVTGGRLNANAAIDAVLSPPAPTPTPTPTATPTPAPPDATPPPAPPVTTPVSVPQPPSAAAVLSALSVRGSLRALAGRLRVTFSLNRAASVRFTITRRGATRPLVGWTSRGNAGSNVFTLTRRLPTGRRLTRGDYTLTVGLNATAAATRSIKVR